jgi:hypothetical protein
MLCENDSRREDKKPEDRLVTQFLEQSLHFVPRQYNASQLAPA